MNLKQCKQICKKYYKGRVSKYERGPHSIEQLAVQYGVSHDTIRRVLRGNYKIKGEVFRYEQ